MQFYWGWKVTSIQIKGLICYVNRVGFLFCFGFGFLGVFLAELFPSSLWWL